MAQDTSLPIVQQGGSYVYLYLYSDNIHYNFPVLPRKFDNVFDAIPSGIKNSAVKDITIYT